MWYRSFTLLLWVVIRYLGNINHWNRVVHVLAFLHFLKAFGMLTLFQQSSHVFLLTDLATLLRGVQDLALLHFGVWDWHHIVVISIFVDLLGDQLQLLGLFRLGIDGWLGLLVRSTRLAGVHEVEKSLLGRVGELCFGSSIANLWSWGLLDARWVLGLRSIARLETIQRFVIVLILSLLGHMSSSAFNSFFVEFSLVIEELVSWRIVVGHGCASLSRIGRKVRSFCSTSSLV